LCFRQYFGSKGIGYTFLRVPFGGTDFSTYNYTYDDVENDVKLEYFSLKKDDFTYKVNMGTALTQQSNT
jgi:hypothetical protein